MKVLSIPSYSTQNSTDSALKKQNNAHPSFGYFGRYYEGPAYKTYEWSARKLKLTKRWHNDLIDVCEYFFTRSYAELKEIAVVRNFLGQINKAKSEAAFDQLILGVNEVRAKFGLLRGKYITLKDIPSKMKRKLTPEEVKEFREVSKEYHRLLAKTKDEKTIQERFMTSW